MIATTWRRRASFAAGVLGAAILFDTAALAAAAPDLTGVWATPTRYIEDGPAAGVPVNVSSTNWAPLSAGRPEDRTPPPFEQQKQAMERIVLAETVVGGGGGGAQPPYTEAGQKAAAERRAAAPAPGAPRNPYAQCQPRNLIGPGNGQIHIAASPAGLLIADGAGAWRTVRIGAAKPADALPSYSGYSVGRWVGNSLVVETTDFAGETANGWPMSDRAKVTETFTPVDGGRRLAVKIVYEDPLMLREPMARMIWFDRQPPDQQVVISTCIENVVGGEEYAQTISGAGNVLAPPLGGPQ